MRSRVLSSVAVVAAAFCIAAGVTAPIVAAFGGDSSPSASVEAGRSWAR